MDLPALALEDVDALMQEGRSLEEPVGEAYEDLVMRFEAVCAMRFKPSRKRSSSLVKLVKNVHTKALWKGAKRKKNAPAVKTEVERALARLSQVVDALVAESPSVKPPVPVTMPTEAVASPVLAVEDVEFLCMGEQAPADEAALYQQLVTRFEDVFDMRFKPSLMSSSLVKLVKNLHTKALWKGAKPRRKEKNADVERALENLPSEIHYLKTRLSQIVEALVAKTRSVKQPAGDLTHDDFSELLANIWRAQGEEEDASTFANVHQDLATSWPSLLHSMAVAMEAAMPDQ
jgi:hypothetical protein